MKLTLLVIRGVRWLLWFVLITTAVISAAVTVTGVTGSVRISSELSGSMAPVIEIGDLVLYRPVRGADLRPGQIVSFTEAGLPIPLTHRVVRVTTTSTGVDVVTKGDSNTAPDATHVVQARQTVWRVNAIMPHGGRIITGITGTHGAVFLIGLLPLLLSLPWLERQVAALGRPGTPQRNSHRASRVSKHSGAHVKSAALSHEFHPVAYDQTLTDRLVGSARPGR